MESTFITIHDLSLDASILYCSTSIGDILQYRPEEVVGRSCWEYFHPDDIPFAQAAHGRGIQLDKAAILHYCRLRNKHGEWIGCECVLTVVYNVLIGCISVYNDGYKSQKRAIEAPIVRQLFSSSPRDPRYHMLSYISSKFAAGPKPHMHEPRAALFLNRFTRSLTINFATDGLCKLLDISPDELMGKSFYYCIQENCLPEAVRCLESAKANDSIAYLRFWYRDPRLVGFNNEDQDSGDDNMSDIHSDGRMSDENMSDIGNSDQSDDDGGGVDIGGHYNSYSTREASEQAVTSDSSVSGLSLKRRNASRLHPYMLDEDPNSRSSSGAGTDLGNDSANAMWDRSSNTRSATSMSSATSERTRDGVSFPGERGRYPSQKPPIEIEAVVSCSTDGLVVVMRAARPFVPASIRATVPSTKPTFPTGMFASPWGTTPIMPISVPELREPQQHTFQHTAPPLAVQEPQAVLSGPPLNDFMASIREVAVFAWALCGINGSLEQYTRGTPMPGAQPRRGLPIWDPDEPRAPTVKDSHYRSGPDPARNFSPSYQPWPHRTTSFSPTYQPMAQ